MLNVSPNPNLSVSEVATEVALPGIGERAHIQREFNSRGGPQAERLNTAVENVGNRGSNGTTQQASIAKVLELAHQLGVKTDALASRGVWQTSRGSEPSSEGLGKVERRGYEASREGATSGVITEETKKEELIGPREEVGTKSSSISGRNEGRPVGAVTKQKADHHKEEGITAQGSQRAGVEGGQAVLSNAVQKADGGLDGDSLAATLRSQLPGARTIDLSSLNRLNPSFGSRVNLNLESHRRS